MAFLPAIRADPGAPILSAATDRGGGVLHLLGCTLVAAALLLAYWGCSADFRLAAWTGP